MVSIVPVRAHNVPDKAEAGGVSRSEEPSTSGLGEALRKVTTAPAICCTSASDRSNGGFEGIGSVTVSSPGAVSSGGSLIFLFTEI